MLEITPKDEKNYYVDIPFSEEVTNNNEVLGLLKDNGFDAWQAEFLSFKAYISKVTNAESIIHVYGEFAEPEAICHIVKKAAERLVKKAVKREGIKGFRRVRFIKDSYTYVSAITGAIQKNPETFSLMLDPHLDTYGYPTENVSRIFYKVSFRDIDYNEIGDSDFFTGLMPPAESLVNNFHRLFSHRLYSGNTVTASMILHFMLEDHYFETMKEVNALLHREISLRTPSLSAAH